MDPAAALYTPRGHHHHRDSARLKEKAPDKEQNTSDTGTKVSLDVGLDDDEGYKHKPRKPAPTPRDRRGTEEDVPPQLQRSAAIAVPHLQVGTPKMAHRSVMVVGTAPTAEYTPMDTPRSARRAEEAKPRTALEEEFARAAEEERSDDERKPRPLHEQEVAPLPVATPRHRGRAETHFAGLREILSPPVAASQSPCVGGTATSTSGSGSVAETPERERRKIETAVGTYLLGEKIGEGAYARVYKALDMATGKVVAVKRFNAGLDQGALSNVVKEIQVLKNLHHKNIMKIFGVHEECDCLHILLEYCENGSLLGMLREFSKFPEHLAAVFVKQVLDALVYLHSHDVIHRCLLFFAIPHPQDRTRHTTPSSPTPS
eukprot:TRINITY_DN2378_c0_g1_i4.p1 TRINITY_DN2378_c0_g1~~TRINITY_DN2378_c0_g1_i4.p1  ORF type:complete len:390 (+),score=77.05 TRINITY_DN2378_c0_g1_i4:54-1172(+)